jgi:hypothetical protein
MAIPFHLSIVKYLKLRNCALFLPLIIISICMKFSRRYNNNNNRSLLTNKVDKQSWQTKLTNKVDKQSWQTVQSGLIVVLSIEPYTVNLHNTV